MLGGVYDIVDQVQAWQRDGKPVSLVRVVETRGFSSRDRGRVAAVTPGAPPAGALLFGGGVLDARILSGLADTERGLVTVDVSMADAGAAGLSCGGSARLLVQPAADLPDVVWPRLRAQEPVCLITEVDGDTVGATTAYTPSDVAGAGDGPARLLARGSSETATFDAAVATALWPVPTMLVVGEGLIADALVAQAGLLGWSSEVTNDVHTATARVAQFAASDAVVVLSHDRDVDCPALAAALDGRPGYIGALGSRRTQAARAEWFTGHGITGQDRIHGPAGLDIGGHSPAEIALSIVAEIVSVRSAAAGSSLRERSGPVRAADAPAG